MNYQVQAIGNDLSIYEYIGTTNHLDEFAIRAGLISKSEKVPITNNFSHKPPHLDSQFVEKFKDAHKEDYAIYERVVGMGVK